MLHQISGAAYVGGIVLCSCVIYFSECYLSVLKSPEKPPCSLLGNDGNVVSAPHQI